MPTPLPRILVVDDEPQIHRFLAPALDAAGFRVVCAETGQEALSEIARKPPEGVILDLGLPDMDGLEVLTRARSFYDGPILIVSGRNRETEKIAALDAGADDYVEKPFAVGELFARLRRVMRQRITPAKTESTVCVGDIRVELHMRRVTRAGLPVKLSRREYDLLSALIKGRGRVITHRQLLTSVWGPENAENVEYVRVFIRNLRAKLEVDASKPTILVTEPGVGYRFIVNNAS